MASNVPGAGLLIQALLESLRLDGCRRGVAYSTAASKTKRDTTWSKKAPGALGAKRVMRATFRVREQ